jgi:TrpR-related protein YerC/YecD
MLTSLNCFREVSNHGENVNIILTFGKKLVLNLFIFYIYKKLMNKWCEKEIREMIQKVSEMKTAEEVESLFDIIATPREINDMARRLEIARMLKNENNYTDIITKLGVSSHTISRVAARVGLGFCRGSQTILNDNSPKQKITVGVSKFKYKGASLPVVKIESN